MHLAVSEVTKTSAVDLTRPIMSGSSSRRVKGFHNEQIKATVYISLNLVTDFQAVLIPN